MNDFNPAGRLAFLAFQMLRPDEYPSSLEEIETFDSRPFKRVRAAVKAMWEALDTEDRSELSKVREDLIDPVGRNPAQLRRRLLWLLAKPTLEQEGHQGDLRQQDVDEDIQLAAARIGSDSARRGDRQLLRAWTKKSEGGQLDTSDDATGKDTEMTDDSKSTRHDTDESNDDSDGVVKIGVYPIDTRFTPDTFEPKRFRKALRRLFRDRDVDLETEESQAHGAYVAGSLLADSYFDPRDPGFDDVFVEHFDRGYERPELKSNAGRQTFTSAGSTKSPRVRNIDVYLAVGSQLAEAKGEDQPTVQEVAAISDAVLERGPVDDNFEAKVRSAFDDYVGKTPVFDSLDLPPLVLDENSEGVYEPTNIRATSMIGAAMHLDRAGLMSAVDTSAQDWSDGVLPVGDSAGRLYDPYVWDARDRLDPAARQIQYDRTRELDDYVLRFCSAVSERERSLDLSAYLIGQNGDRRTPQPTDASVRKCARDLLGYASLHGWAYTQFAAKRVGNHIRQCVDIIENSEVQKAYGVQGPWQVVERINTMSGGASPNITKELTLSSTGKEIVDLLASKSAAIAANLASVPLFPLPILTTTQSTTVFSRGEYETLLVLVENWLAANAITDSQRFDAAQPREVAPSTSLPSMNGFMGGDPGALKDQLLQMVNAGQMPTVDQLNSLFNRQN